MASYYNEWDPYAAQWIRNLIAAGLIAPGDVDERSIAEVQPGDLAGYTQCHFFAGIGGWSYALRLAGWPDERPVWTGSCPCQPFSVAGKQKGFEDERHLWPEFRRLIAIGKPSVIFGEQVAKAADWLGLVRSDLEAMEYAMAAIPIEAASAGADHFRDRYWFVAGVPSERGNWLETPAWPTGGGVTERDGCRPLANNHAMRELQPQGREQKFWRWNRDGRETADVRPLADGHGHGHGQRSQVSLCQSSDFGAKCAPASGGDICSLVDASSLGWGEGWTESEFRRRGFTAAVASIDGMQYVECSDGKWRRLPPPGVRWLGNGIPARVAKLRAFGNAIDPRPAAEFIRAYRELI